jgi:hypothetical protein
LAGTRAAALSAPLLGAALAAVAFGAAGGSELSRTSVVEVLLVLACGALVAFAVLRGRASGPGGTALVCFAALAAVTALSVTWSTVPGESYVEAGRTLAYLSVFAAAVAAARLAPRVPDTVLTGILLAAVAAVGYSLASRVWPASLAANELSNRIGAPFQYWNAVGTTAALAVPGLLWLGSRRTGGAVARALAYPGMAVAILAILLTSSRGALAAGAVGALAWFAIVPLRLRSVPVLLVPAAAAGALGAWALSKDAFSKTLQPLAAKEAVAGDFGLLLLLMVALTLLAGLLVGVALSRSLPPLRVRRRLGLVVAALVAVLALAGLTTVAASGGVDDLVSESDTAEQGASRFTDTSNSRGKYWGEAWQVFEDRPAAGAGAGAFEVARLRHREDESSSRHAHGFVVQTLADLGIAGMAVALALLAAWLAAAARTTGLVPRRLPRRDWDEERIAFVALTLVAVTFGLQSAIDWTWFVPGPTAMALVAAGFVAGRGPLPAVGGRAAAAAQPPGPSARTGRAVATAAVALAALLVAWAVWQPEAASRMTADAHDLSDARSYDAALAKAGDAADANPLSPDPLLERASIELAAGRDAAAGRTLEDAVLSFPGDPDTWLRLSRYQLQTLGRPRRALETVRGVLYLDPFSLEGRSLYLNSLSALRRAG